MSNLLVEIHKNCFVNKFSIIAVSSYSSAPVRRMVSKLKSEGKLINLSFGREIKSVIYHDNGNITVTGASPESVHKKINNKKEGYKYE